MIELFIAVWHAIVLAGNSLLVFGRISARFMREDFRAHFNLIAQYTAPFEQEILQTTPPQPKDLSIFGQIALTVVLPLNPIAWLLALTLWPLVYNGSLLLVSLFVRTYNLALFDLPKRQLSIPEGSLPVHRLLYGLPGLLLGSFLGLASTVGIALLRTLINSAESAWLHFKGLSMLALEQPYKDERDAHLKYLFGLPGLVLGIIFGFPGFLLTGTGRVLLESGKSTGWVAQQMINSLIPDESMKLNISKPATSTLNRVLGFPGWISGFTLGVLGMGAVIVVRSAVNSWYSLAIGFTKVANQALFGIKKMQLSEDIDGMLPVQKYGFGWPGILLGGLAGFPSAFAILFGRVIGDTAVTAYKLMVSAGHVVWHGERAKKYGLETDDRGIVRNVLGLPGFLFGAPLAAMAFLSAGLARSVRESSTTSNKISGWMTDLVMPEKEETSSEKILTKEKAEQPAPVDRSLFNRILGAPGMISGVLFGTVGMTAVVLGRTAANSFYSLAIGFAKVANLGLFDSKKIRLSEDINGMLPVQKYGFGWPGILLGGLAGIPSVFAILFGRVIGETAITAYKLMVSTGHLVWHGERAKAHGLETDGRGIARNVLGSPGFLFGAPLAAMAFLSAGLTRSIRESSTSSNKISGWMADLVMPKKKRSMPETSEATIEEPTAPKRSPFNRVLGAPGLLIGAFFGSIAMVAIVLGRSAANSWYSLAIGFTAVVNPVLHKDDELALGGVIQDMTPVHKYRFGFPGLVFGAIAGIPSAFVILIGRAGGNSALSTYRMIVSAGHFAWHGEAAKKDGLETDDRGFLRTYVLGLPGMFLGAVLGAMAFLSAGLARTVRESATTSNNISGWMTALVMPEKTQSLSETQDETPSETNEATDDPKRHPFKQFLGIPGMLSGVLFGAIAMAAVVVARAAANSWYGLAIGFTRVVNPVLHEDDELVLSKFVTEMTPVQKRFGIPGIVFGGFAGFPSALAILFGRAVSNSALSLYKINLSAGHLAWHGETAKADGLETDNRGILRNILGLPGLLVGAPLAGAAFLSAGFARMVRESSTTSNSISGWMADLAMPAKEDESFEKILSEEGLLIPERDPFNRFLGAPGMISGVVFGAVAVAAIVLARTAANSWYSIAIGFTNVVNPFLHKDDDLVLSDTVKEMTPIQRYRFGLPGIIIGGFVGVPSAFAVLLGRAGGNSLLSSYKMIVSAGHYAWHGETAKRRGLETDGRGFLRSYVLGLPGLILGAPFAAAGFLSAIVARIVRESITRSNMISGWMTELVMPVKEQVIAEAVSETVSETAEEAEETSIPEYSLLNRFLGAPGVLTGVLFGAIGMTAVVLARIAANSWNSLIFSFVQVANLGFFGMKKIELSASITEIRPAQQYGFGLPGIVIGGFAGIPSAFAIFCGRVILNTAVTAYKLVVSAGHFAWHGETAPEHGLEADEAGFLDVYVLGFPGLALGAPFAAAAFLSAGLARVSFHSALSWASLSGSLINGSLRRPAFSGLGGDERVQSQKMQGLPGYVVAVLTTLPASLIILAARSATPFLVFFVAGLTVSPLIAVLKWLKMGTGAPRFVAEPGQEPVEEQKFRNIYSSLNVWGQLPERGDVPDNQNGSKGVLCFARKALTFNVSSMTENALDMLLQAWRDTPLEERSQFFAEDGRFTGVIQRVKDYYQDTSCLEFADTISRREAQIDEIGAFAKAYIEGESKQFPARVYSARPSWSSVFWGDSRRAGYESIADAAHDSAPQA